MPRFPILSKLTRGQKILALVGIVIIALYVTGVTATNGSTSGDPANNGLVKTLSGWFAKPDPVALADVSGPCLTESTLTVQDTCVIDVAKSDADLRELLLHPDGAMHLRTRAPHDETILDKDVEAGSDIKVAVDDKGTQITLTCTCTVTLGGGNG